MNKATAFLMLLACALLETLGDALARKGMHAQGVTVRLAFYAAAAALLFSYGWLVNRPPWSFGSLLGGYVAILFVVAQVVAFFFLHEKPNTPLLAGGALIVAGGLVVTLWQ